MPNAAAAVAGVIVPRALGLGRRGHTPSLVAQPRFSPWSPCRLAASSKPRLLTLVAASAASFDELNARGKSHQRASKNIILSNLIQEIEPLDVSLIQKDVPADTVDAMKRTISSMLGLLPSDQFNVMVEAFWNPIFKLLVSSMVTGYTLRNAEYRLCLEKNLGVCKELSDKQNLENAVLDGHGTAPCGTSRMPDSSGRNEFLLSTEATEEVLDSESIGVEGLGEMSPEAQEYIIDLQCRISSMEKELHDVKRQNAALQMQHFVGEEKNDLLDYLRSLQPEKVAELSEPTCPGLQETIDSVAHGLLAILSPKIHTKAPPHTENATGGSSLDIGKDDCPELVENTSLQFQPLISVSRDYLARLLFWCMLLGHYMRGLEYRLELMQLLTIPESIPQDGGSIS
ncbi:hypothetical protein J5N97_008511 [Dioscorea zingiberensis]|uniref:Uncharacterized protein n=1 Tax=Dioscorea zingiberensis TaxID=325984 RepID=A0A9D5CV10_9LILI|nr:hypothetical protein J5N97_008511 [Dioscorea zingiberensis]